MALNPAYETMLFDGMKSNPSYADILPQLHPYRSLVEEEVKLHYLLDITAHVMVVTSKSALEEVTLDLKQTFQKAIVLMTAITAALGQNEISVFDYDAHSRLLRKSGFFTFLGAQKRKFKSTSVSATMSAQLVAFVLSSIGKIDAISGAAAIAGKLIASLQGDAQLRLSITGASRESKVGHVLLVCQDLFGMPMVSTSTYFLTLKESEILVNIDCAQAASSTVEFAFQEESYMFTDPAFIAKFTPEFVQSDAYKDLINRLATLAKPPTT
jgi:hypothetical protein